MRVMEDFLFEVLRLFTVKTEIKPGNLVLIFSAAAYDEFKIITKTVINNSDLSIGCLLYFCPFTSSSGDFHILSISGA
jgi:hypothetical protein